MIFGLGYIGGIVIEAARQKGGLPASLTDGRSRDIIKIGVGCISCRENTANDVRINLEKEAPNVVIAQS